MKTFFYYLQLLLARNAKTVLTFYIRHANPFTVCNDYQNDPVKGPIVSYYLRAVKAALLKLRTVCFHSFLNVPIGRKC
jgi:hypothetical protein